MIYADIEKYNTLFPSDPVDSFDRLAWDASRLMDNLTTGVDGIKKLKFSYPTDEDDAEAVARCACNLVHLLYRLEVLAEQAEQATGYTKNDDGTYQSNLVSSRSAGNESISYANGSNLSKATIMSAAASDPLTREKLLRDTCTASLTGVHDANGVNLLYMGNYPEWAVKSDV